MIPTALLSPLFAAALLAQPVATPTPLQPTPPPAPSTNVPLPAQTPTPAAAPSVTPSLAPSAAPAAACPAGPVVTPPPTPLATPNYTYHFVPRQPEKLAPCQPQIFEVDLNSKDLVSAGDIDIRVLTNQYVARVVSKSGGREGTIPAVQPNEFIAFSKLPKLPFIARGMTVDLQFVGYGVDGRTVSVTVPVHLH